jgi:NADH:ubiquinone oxidoreductase subunit 4 (subunit M)
VGFGTSLVAAAGRPWRVLTSLYVLRVVTRFSGAESADPHFQHLPDAGREWALVAVFVIVLFGIAPSLAISPIDSTTVPLLMRLGAL